MPLVHDLAVTERLLRKRFALSSAYADSALGLSLI